MKHFKWLVPLIAAGLVSSMALATCVPPLSLQATGASYSYPYQVAYDTGTNNSCFTYYLDKSGNVSIAGNQTTYGNQTVIGNSTNTGTTIYPSTFASLVSSITTISPASTYIVVSATATNGGSVTCGQSTFGGPGSTAAAPCISTSTAVNGQYLIISSTQNTNQGSVTFSSGTASGMDLGSGTRVVQYGKTLSLIFDAVSSMWREVAYGNN